MRERPILFSAPMVRAILEGRKTQTRRVVKPQPESAQLLTHSGWSAWHNERGQPLRNRYGQPGDRLWVRETHAIFATHGQHRKDRERWGPWGGLPMSLSPDMTQIAYYREGFDRCDPGRWRPSIHMPRWASRITLEVTGVRIERLHALSEADALAEGIHSIEIGPGYGPRYSASPRTWPDAIEGHPDVQETAVAAFRELWESINGLGSWLANPWVWVVEFKRL